MHEWPTLERAKTGAHQSQHPMRPFFDGIKSDDDDGAADEMMD